MPTSRPGPPLKWAGGKRWLVPTLLEIWRDQEHRRLVEPFVGGLAVALGLRPHAALLNDTNVQVVNFYKWLQKGLIIDIPMENDGDVYYAHRDRFNELLSTGQVDSREAAQLFYFLNRTGYNGLCRFNSKGLFNVPFGKYASVNYTRDFSAYRDVLTSWDFSSVDFADLPTRPEDFIYADPPYDVEFTGYSPGGFRWADQVRLAEWLAAQQCPVVASNQATPRILDLYESLGFEITVLDAPRMISCNGDRTPAKEMLALREC